jgi:Na+:H+ antiporter, NhaA family
MRSAAAVHGHVHHAAPPAIRWPSHFFFEYLLVLPLGAALAIVWANTDPESYYRTAYSIAFFVNEVAMALFFGWITKEIVEGTAPGGLFHPWRRVLLPVACAAAGIGASLVVYDLVFAALGAPMLGPGWPVLCAIDLAAAYFFARVIFGRHPAVTFLLLMGIAANGIGFVALALFYPMRDAHLGLAALLMAAAIAIAVLLRAGRVRTFWPYVIGGGTLSWLALYAGGFHTAFALVPIVALLPHAARDPGFFVDAPAGARDALDRFERWCRMPAQVSLLLFGFVNAGVPFRALELDGGQWAVPVALAVGRPAGVLAAIALALAAGVHVPRRVHWRALIVLALLSGVGFTLALFFASAVFPAGQLLNETRIGTLLSLSAAPLALAAARLLRVGRFGS